MYSRGTVSGPCDVFPTDVWSVSVEANREVLCYLNLNFLHYYTSLSSEYPDDFSPTHTAVSPHRRPGVLPSPDWRAAQFLKTVLLVSIKVCNSGGCSDFLLKRFRLMIVGGCPSRHQYNCERRWRGESFLRYISLQMRILI